MKLVSCSIIGLLSIVTCALLPQRHPVLHAQSISAEETSFKAFLPEFERGLTDFVNGDPARWKQHVSQRNDGIIMGGWGAYEKGWPEVSSRYDWAAARFRKSGANVEPEYLTIAVSGDLAYTVTIERSTVLLVDQEKPAPMALRVTHVFRKEAAGWKLVLRHADQLIGKTAPASVLQK